MAKKLLDLYLREEIIRQCDKHFKQYLKEEGSDDRLTEENYELIEKQMDFLFEMMDEIIKDYNADGIHEMEAYAHIIDQLCGYCILGKMNEARLCNIINDILEKDDE